MTKENRSALQKRLKGILLSFLVFSRLFRLGVGVRGGGGGIYKGLHVQCCEIADAGLG